MFCVIRSGKVLILNSEDSCVACYMLDYGKICLIQFTKVNKRPFNAIKIKCLVAWYKLQVTCLQQFSI